MTFIEKNGKMLLLIKDKFFTHKIFPILLIIMTTFFIIRHGYSKSNEQGYFTGQTDVALSTLGVEQANQTARYLYENFKIDLLYSSPLQRAFNTTLPISNLFNLPILIENDFKEINGGDWEEKTPKQILKLYKDDYTLWLNNIGIARCTNGENMQEVQSRALNALKKLASQYDEKNIAITTHAGVIRALQCAFQNLPLSEMKNIPWVENASISIINYENGTFSPLKISFSEHLTSSKTNLPSNM